MFVFSPGAFYSMTGSVFTCVSCTSLMTGCFSAMEANLPWQMSLLWLSLYTFTCISTSPDCTLEHKGARSKCPTSFLPPPPGCLSAQYDCRWRPQRSCMWASIVMWLCWEKESNISIVYPEHTQYPAFLQWPVEVSNTQIKKKYCVWWIVCLLSQKY